MRKRKCDLNMLLFMCHLPAKHEYLSRNALLLRRWNFLIFWKVLIYSIYMYVHVLLGSFYLYFCYKNVENCIYIFSVAITRKNCLNLFWKKSKKFTHRTYSENYLYSYAYSLFNGREKLHSKFDWNRLEIYYLYLQGSKNLLQTS